MGIKIVTGGTTGAQDGTLVSSGNRLTFTGAGNVAAHVRCDDGYWSDDQAFTLEDVVGVLPLEVSFDGGSTWLDDADGPVCPEIEDVNFPVLFRQTAPAAVGETAREFSTPGDGGTYNAITALSTPTLTATVISDTQIDLSWTNVSNEDGYTLERSTASDFSANLVSVSKGANVTTHSATGLASGTHYWFRVRAEGSGRYSDSGWGSDDATTPAPSSFTEYAFADASETITTDGTDLWVWSNTPKISKITTAGSKTEYTSGLSGVGDSYGACLGPDGRLWFTDYTNNKVYAITTGGIVSAYTTGFAGKGVCGICSDGADLFVACLTTHQILKVTAATGAVASTFSAGATSGPFQICWNSGDSMLWFTQNSTHEIAKISNTGTGLTEYATTGSSSPYGICVGPDGNLWAVLNGTDKIAKITTSGTVTEYATGVTDSSPRYICSDGASLWATDYTPKKLLNITTGGTVTPIAMPATRAPNEYPLFLVLGPDDRLWLTTPQAGAYGYAYGPV